MVGVSHLSSQFEIQSQSISINQSQSVWCYCSIMVGVSHLSLTVNSSVNFLIYFSLGKRFQAAARRWWVGQRRLISESISEHFPFWSNFFLLWMELEIHPRAIKIEFPLKICKQIWKLDWEKICSKILYEVMEQLSFLCLLRCPFIKWQKYISYIFVQVQSSVSGEVVNSNWGQSVTKSALELESKLM